MREMKVYIHVKIKYRNNYFFFFYVDKHNILQQHPGKFFQPLGGRGLTWNDIWKIVDSVQNSKAIVLSVIASREAKAKTHSAA